MARLCVSGTDAVCVDAVCCHVVVCGRVRRREGRVRTVREEWLIVCLALGSGVRSFQVGGVACTTSPRSHMLQGAGGRGWSQAT